MQYIKSLILAVSALAMASASAVPNAEAEAVAEAAAVVDDTSFTENVWKPNLEARKNRCYCKKPHGGRKRYRGSSSIIVGDKKRNHCYQCYKNSNRCEDLGKKKHCGSDTDDDD
ncbi:hypothetical protein AC578_8969 [Pseudocercospora eumusae]|uniref:Uncharacterized protein n=1 Tax=Pseudocercospora eumusae TaxID=321146 RepID=A0A139HA80_9PEZI|nr:hypothetical protein AC578_8969 [Pseudocercospora eumusae]